MNLRFGIVLGALSVVACSQAAVLMDQIGSNPNDISSNEKAFTSQRFESSNSAFDVASLDDFSLSGGSRLTSVEAVVSLFNGGNLNFNAVQSWNVEIYSSVAAAQSNLSGDIASITSSPTITNSYFTSNTVNGLVNLPVDVTLAAGTYWISVVARYNFSDGQAGINMSSFAGGFPNNTNATGVNPGGGFGGGPFALQDNSGANVNLAYRINGEPVPEPASMIALTLGAAALIRRRRNS